VSLKKINALASLISTYALEYDIRKIQEGLKLDGTHQLLVYADHVNLLSENVNAIKRNTENLVETGNLVCIVANIERTKYMFTFIIG
jgi:hypothetical protein